MATYLLVTLFFTADPAIDREAALKAARAKYDAMISAAEKAYPKAAINKAKADLADLRRSVVNPGIPGMSISVDGNNVRYGPIQFPDSRSRQRAIDEATAKLKKVEADSELRKNGLLPAVKTEVMPLEFTKLAVGQVGQLGIVEIVSVLDEGDTLARMMSWKNAVPETTPVVIIGRSTTPELVFWVSGKRTIGKQSLFVIEPLFAD
jgi:hypothetical protein